MYGGRIDESTRLIILSLEELIENHKGLNRGVYLGNSITA